MKHYDDDYDIDYGDNDWVRRHRGSIWIAMILGSWGLVAFFIWAAETLTKALGQS